MCKINAMDLVNIQECLESYKKLLNWIPILDEDDYALKDSRLTIIDHLIEKCDDVLTQEVQD